MFRKVLVANRGEIAVRAFRAATELGARTVAVFPYEDRKSEHRLKADEAYQIGEEGHPVRAYLDHEAIVAQAVEAGADAIYPGYGFLSENPLLAEACEAAGITFIGPPPSVLHLTGNKARAIAAARDAGLPTLRGAEPGTDLDVLAAAADEIGFPVFVKAVSGGGGRGRASSASRSAFAAPRRRRMPRPPPPQTALTKTGKPISSAAAASASRSVPGSEPRSVGSPPSRAAAMARALLPVRCSTDAGGPMKVMPAARTPRRGAGSPRGSRSRGRSRRRRPRPPARRSPRGRGRRGPGGPPRRSGRPRRP